MMRASRENPNISTYMKKIGDFDYNAISIAPPGTTVVINKDP